MVWKILLNFIMILLLTSCSTLPIENKTLISIVGFDSEQGKIKITALLKNPSVLGKTQNSSRQNEKPDSLLKIEGHTIDYATHQASAFVPRHIDWNHLHMVIIGEDLAKTNLQHVLGFLNRQPESNTTPYFFISKGETARSLLEQAARFSYPPFLMLREITDSAREHTFIQPIRVKEILNKVNSDLTDVTVPGIQMNKGNYKTAGGHPSFMVTDTAALHDNRFDGWLGPKAEEGLLWVTGNMWDHSFEIDLPSHQLYVNFDVSEHKSKTSVTFSKDKLQQINMDISVAGRITEISDPHKLKLVSTKEIEDKLSRMIANSVKSAVHFSQKQKTDIFGFGYEIRKQDQNYWLRHKEHWSEDLYSKIPVKVKVKTTIEDWGDLR